MVKERAFGKMAGGLILALAISSIACGGSTASSSPSASSSAARDWARPQGWDSNPYYNWIDNAWDSAVLPSCVPKEVPGVRVESTTYKEKRQDVLNQSYGLGMISFKDANFERWGVSFYCTNAQLEEFVAAMAANGFVGGFYDMSYYPEYHWYGNGYYAFMQVNHQIYDEEEYDNLAMFSITPADGNPRPIAFKGTRLPDFGAVLYDNSLGVGFGYNNDDGDEVENFWNPITDTGTLPAMGWSFWLEYFGVTDDQARAYAQSMVSQGWSITYESTTYDGAGYAWYLAKDDMVGGIEVDEYLFKVGFGSQSEYLWY